MRMFLIAMCLLAMGLTACDTASAPISESGGSTGPVQLEESDPALLLSEDSAISIVQAFLQECVLSWSVEHAPPASENDAERGTRTNNGWDYEAWLAELRAERKMKRGAPLPSEQEQTWWMNLATGTARDVTWSAQYHGVTEIPNSFDRLSRDSINSETWIVVGPGFGRAGTELEVVPGRWKVYAGHRLAYALDAPARLAIEEYKKPLDPYFDPDCSGYRAQ